MEMLQILEADKEQVMSGLRRAGSPENAQSVIEKEFDRLLLRYNEECAEERARDEARHMLQTAKMLIPLICAAPETKVWSGGGGSSADEGMHFTKTSVACIAAGILSLAGAVLGPALAAGDKIPVTALLGALPAAILGGLLLFWGGRASLRGARGGSALRGKNGAGTAGSEPSQQVEILIDPDRVWSCMRGAVLSADKALREAVEAANYERNRLPESAEGGGLVPEEAELFAGLLESAYTEREEDPGNDTAQEMISRIRYYLHRKQVETVDFGGGKREWFELLPGKQAMTLRPALVKEGVLLRKGLAVAGQ